MLKTCKIHLSLLLALLLLFTITQGNEVRGESKSTEQIVEFLIDAIARSHLMFIGNGTGHNCIEAAEHVRKKYEYFRSGIKTPEDFITLCASKSILSGKLYLVVTEQGEMPVAKWLKQRLADYTKGQVSRFDQPSGPVSILCAWRTHS